MSVYNLWLATLAMVFFLTGCAQCMSGNQESEVQRARFCVERTMNH